MQAAYVRDFETPIKSNGSAVRGQERCKAEFARKTITVNGKQKEIEVCYIRVPGDKTQLAGLRVTEEIKRRFPAEYLAFTNGDVMPVDGTPIEHMPGIGGSLALQMKATGLHTIEDLANMTDGIAKSFQGGLGLREKAKLFLANKKPDQSDELRSMVAQQQQQIAELMAMLKGGSVPAPKCETAMEIESATEKRGPGRPKKE